MDVVFGVYLGNSTCCVAVNKDSNVNVVANAGGDRVTPAVVAVHDEEVLTGLPAKQGLLRFGARSIVNILKAISATEPVDRTTNNNGATCPPCWDDDGDVSYSVQTDSGPRVVQAVSVLRHLFLQMKDISSRHNTAPQCTACLCLPAWVSNKAVTVIREAAREAGYRIVAVVLQPTAACLAYDLLQDRTQDMLVVTLHLGESGSVGGVLEVSGGMVTVRDTATSTTEPGSTLTNKLVEHLAKEFYTKYHGDPLDNKRSRQKLYNQAETVKHVLSTRQSAQVNVESLWEGVDFSCQVSRARFEGLISSTLTELLQPTLAMLARLNINPQDIDKVVVSGGTCKIPRLQQLIKETFPSADVLASIPADEVLAYGAAIEARAVTTRYGDKGDTAVNSGSAVNSSTAAVTPATPTSTKENKSNSSTPTANSKDNKNNSATPTANGKDKNLATPSANGKENKNASKKKATRAPTERRKQEVMRSHLPVLVSALSVPVWCKVTGSDSSVCALPRLSPPLLRNTFSVPLPPVTENTVACITIYESPKPITGQVPAAAVLAEIKAPVTRESKELNISCQLKPDGTLQLSVLEPISKKYRKFVVAAEEDDDSN